MHKKIMEKASKDLKKDAAGYKAKAKIATGAKKNSTMAEHREAATAAKKIKSLSKKV